MTVDSRDHYVACITLLTVNWRLRLVVDATATVSSSLSLSLFGR